MRGVKAPVGLASPMGEGLRRKLKRLLRKTGQDLGAMEIGRGREREEAETAWDVRRFNPHPTGPGIKGGSPEVHFEVS